MKRVIAAITAGTVLLFPGVQSDAPSEADVGGNDSMLLEGLSDRGNRGNLIDRIGFGDIVLSPHDDDVKELYQLAELLAEKGESVDEDDLPEFIEGFIKLPYNAGSTPEPKIDAKGYWAANSFESGNIRGSTRTTGTLSPIGILKSLTKRNLLETLAGLPDLSSKHQAMLQKLAAVPAAKRPVLSLGLGQEPLLTGHIGSKITTKVEKTIKISKSS
eukprot:GHVQ01031463.1.p1 GENE.GHVQ01031463.1~~GHVQ01031463.1.p1  ORF type:complete len:216 (-),score=32.76 GHVQ01031463.1:81-728(-)